VYVSLLLLFFFSLGQERELSDVSEWAGPTVKTPAAANRNSTKTLRIATSTQGKLHWRSKSDRSALGARPGRAKSNQAAKLKMRQSKNRSFSHGSDRHTGCRQNRKTAARQLAVPKKERARSTESLTDKEWEPEKIERCLVSRPEPNKRRLISSRQNIKITARATEWLKPKTGAALLTNGPKTK
jgi:hypothetical protein